MTYPELLSNLATDGTYRSVMDVEVNVEREMQDNRKFIFEWKHFET